MAIVPHLAQQKTIQSIKRDIGALCVGGVVVWAVLEYAIDSSAVILISLAVYGGTGLLWLLGRIKFLLQRSQQ